MQIARNKITSRRLLLDPKLGCTSKMVYNLLLLHPKRTIEENAKVFKMRYEALRRHIQQLKEFDWVYESGDPKTKQALIVPCMPLDVEREVANMLEYLRQRATLRGEWLLKKLLDHVVDDDDYVDNCRPEWAVSGDGSFPFEYDRHYETARVAIEFQGRQHYDITPFTPDKRALQERMARDRLKELACIRRNIAFVEFTTNDLSYDAIVTKLGHLLPLIPPRIDRPIFRTLTNMCDSYVNRTQREMN